MYKHCAVTLSKLPFTTPGIVSGGSVRDVMVRLMSKSWEISSIHQGELQSDEDIAAAHALFEGLISHPKTVRNDERRWQEVVTILKEIARDNEIPLEDALVARVLNGADAREIPYRHSVTFVVALADYVRDLYESHLRGKKTELNAAIRLYPVSSNGACLDGEIASIHEAKAQINHPFAGLIKSILAETVTGCDLKYCPEGSARHIILGLEILVGVDPALIKDSFARVAMSYIRESDAIQAVVTFWESVAEQINSAYAELVSILAKGSLSRTDKAVMERNLLYRVIQYEAAADGSSAITWCADGEEAKTLSLQELRESIIEWLAEQGTPPTDDIDTIASTCETNPKRYPGLDVFIQQRQYTCPNPEAGLMLTKWVTSLFGAESASIQSGTRFPDSVQAWHACRSSKDSLEAFKASLSERTSVSSVHCFLEMAMITLDALPEGNPDKRFQLAQFLQTSGLLEIITERFSEDSLIQTRVRAIKTSLQRPVNERFKGPLPDPLESATDDFIWKLLVADPPSDVMRLIKALPKAKLCALVTRIEAEGFFTPEETSPNLLVRLCTWVLSPEVIEASGAKRVLTLFQTQTTNGLTLLHWAAEKGHDAVFFALLSVEVIRLLGPEVVLALFRLRDNGSYGFTPLHWAAQEGHSAIFKALLNLDVIRLLGPHEVLALFHLRDTSVPKYTLLHWAAQKGRQDVLREVFCHEVVEVLGVEGVLAVLKLEGETPRKLTPSDLIVQKGLAPMLVAFLKGEAI